mgnify:CR=1 FL=1
MKVIGVNKEGERYELYFRCSRGYKYAVTMYSDTTYGIRDLYMCGTIPNMSREDYNNLKDCIEE